MIRVLIADDLALLRSALRLLLEQEFNVEIVGEVSETGSLLPIVQHLAPDALLLDWTLPGLHCHAARQALIAALRRLAPCLCLVILYGNQEAVRPQRMPGIDAWISKAEPAPHLLTTLATLWLPQPSQRLTARRI